MSVNKNNTFAQAFALQHSSRNCYPAHDLVVFKLNLPRVFVSGGRRARHHAGSHAGRHASARAGAEAVIIVIIVIIGIIVISVNQAVGSAPSQARHGGGRALIVAQQTPTNQTPTKNMFHDRQVICYWMEKRVFVLALISSQHISDTSYMLCRCLPGHESKRRPKRFWTASRRGQHKQCLRRSAAIPQSSTFMATCGNMYGIASTTTTTTTATTTTTTNNDNIVINSKCYLNRTSSTGVPPTSHESVGRDASSAPRT